jgi:NTP pyrophosphatase (non-canonical NTP hydrolase)
MAGNFDEVSRREARRTFAQMENEIERLNRSKGWYDEDRSVGDMVALLHSELSEVLEAYRRHKFEDATKDFPGLGSGKPEGVGAEMADCLIRLLDMATRWDIDLVAEYERKMKYNWTRSYRHGGRTL